jgi:outer membrane lipoprotein
MAKNTPADQVNRMKATLAILTATLLVTACSVISREVRDQAAPAPPFETLIAEADAFRGQTVIMGGYLLEVSNHADGSTLKALQTPLSSSDRPLEKDRSQGRLIITTDQFLDPEIYTKGRQITVAGKIAGSSRAEGDKAPFPYLELEALEIHLWPQTSSRPYPNTYYGPRWYGYDPWYWNSPWYWNDPWYRHGGFGGIHGSWYWRRY